MRENPHSPEISGNHVSVLWNNDWTVWLNTTQASGANAAIKTRHCASSLSLSGFHILQSLSTFLGTCGRLLCFRSVRGSLKAQKHARVAKRQNFGHVQITLTQFLWLVWQQREGRAWDLHPPAVLSSRKHTQLNAPIPETRLLWGLGKRPGSSLPYCCLFGGQVKEAGSDELPGEQCAHGSHVT